jgi:uncharacterized protein YecE (DUF72 family)
LDDQEEAKRLTKCWHLDAQISVILFRSPIDTFGTARVATKSSNLLIGTSGWSYHSWRGRFFPHDLPAHGQLDFYARQFSTTELNGVFYRTPTAEAVRSWKENTPEGFVFAWKASKFITHWKRLNDTSRNSLALLEDRLHLLGKKAGPVLFQLPPQFKKDRERLTSFVKLLSSQRQYAFEFRHASSYDDDILDLLREKSIALCISDHREAPTPWIVTARQVYLRAHGPQGQYRGRYPAETLKSWKRKLETLLNEGYIVYVYFDNDQKGAATKDASLLMGMLRSRTTETQRTRRGKLARERSGQ